MPRGNGEGRDRRERRHRNDRRHAREPREHSGDYPTAPRAHREDYPPPPEYTPHQPEYQPEPQPRHVGRDNAPPLRRRGLNEDYYNPPLEEYEPPRRRHHKSRRSDDGGYERRRHVPAADTGDEDEYYEAKPKRRSKTESGGRHRGRSSGRRYDSDYTDADGYDSMPERPAKHGRGKSFLNAIGIGSKAEKGVERGRGRSPRRSPSRGRRSYRDHSYSPSPSPTRRHRSAGGARTGGRASGEPGLKRSNTNWQRAAGSAMRAGATAAYELRNDPSPWMGPKGIRVATAALGAAVMDTFMEDKHPKRSGGMRHRAARRFSEAALNHIVTGGARSRSRKRYH